MAVFAADNKNATKGLTIIGDVTVTSERSSTKLISQTKDAKGKLINTYRATISSLPSNLSDLKTIINTSWTKTTDDSGQVIFKSGANVFSSQIVGNKVSVLDDKGRIYSWTSTIQANGVELIPSKAEITDDLFNDSYYNNCVMWNYGTVKKNDAIADFFVINNDSATVTRYIRSIEGMIQEFWVINKDPECNITIRVKDNKEEKMEGNESKLLAYDAEGSIIEIEELMLNIPGKTYLISKEQMAGKKYPIYIDPDVSFTINSSDGFLESEGGVYNTIHNAASSSSSPYTTGTIIKTGQQLVVATYDIYRGFLYFDTSSIPDTAVISVTNLDLYCVDDYSDTDFYITLKNGQVVFPHSPLVVGDYLSTQYTGNGGQIYTSNVFSDQRFLIDFNSTGIGWINKTGTTKLALISSYDTVATAPTGKEYVSIGSYEMGSGYQSILTVTYSVPAVTPTITTGVASGEGTTSATLNGVLVSDGRGDPNIVEYCSANFEYGLTTSYGSTSQIYSGYTSGQSVVIGVVGLSKGTLYNFRAKATNSSYTATGANAQFLTLPDAPYGTSVTTGNEQNILNWSKGAGAVRTMVRYRTDAFPSSTVDGTQAYYGTLATYTHAGLTGGTPYYYSFWSETTSGALQQFSSTYVYNSGIPYTVSAPTVLTTDATEVTDDSGRMNGYMSSANQPSDNVTLSIQWDTDGVAPWANEDTATPATYDYDEYGSFYFDATILPAATTHYYRVKAVGAGGTSYGTIKNFTTGGYSAPTITTSTDTNAGLDFFTLNGVVTNDGGLTAGVTVYFDYGSSGAYGTATPSITGLSTGDTFHYTLNNLNYSTTYHYRAAGTNTMGTGYGDDEEATTLDPVSPVVITGTSPIAGSTSATLSGLLSSDGGADCDVRFDYGLNYSYGSSTGWQSGKITGSEFTALLENLDLGVTYHYRAVARNVTGTTTGNDVTFSTIFAPPPDFVAKYLNSSTASLTWTRYGEQTKIVMKKTGFPVDRTDGETVYFGTEDRYTVSGLTGGNTYYFSAWTWRSGDIWTSTYSESAVTMPISTIDEITDAEKWTDPLTTNDQRLYQSIDDTKLQTIPFYDIINDAATDSRIPAATLWFIIGIGLSIVVASFASSMFMWNSWVFIIVTVIAMWAVSLTTMIPWWVALLVTILAVLYVAKFKGNR
jgi:hypothetical protein